MHTTQASSRGEVMVVNATIIGHSKIDFDRKKIRKTLRVEGRKLQREARRRVSRRAVSTAGQDPGLDSGTLRKSIDLVWGRGAGWWVKVEPTTKGIKASGKMYYPAVLYYGSAKRGIEPRANYMTEALMTRAAPARAAIRAALEEALIPR